MLPTRPTHLLGLTRLVSHRLKIPAKPAIFPRFNSTVVEPAPRKPFHRAKVAARYTSYLVLSSVFGVFVIGAGILIHDAFTYTEKHVDRVPVSPLALHPERGGPKNLPIVRVQVDDEQDEENVSLAEKPKLVIVGGGWGAMGVLKTLHVGDYHVTVVSSETFTTFTPLLPSAAVGTVQVRSLIEPIRKIIARLRGHYVQGKAVDLCMKERLLEVETMTADGQHSRVYVPYDKLVIAVGSTSSTHGVPGLENCFQLKTIADAQAIRRRIMDNFEIASLPTTSPEERKRLLSFVVCGGGPTGVETAAEDGKTVKYTIPTNFVLWSTGIAMNPFTKRVSDLLPNQVHKKAIVVDAHLRVKGAPLGELDRKRLFEELSLVHLTEVLE
ncbi:hypothetical protein H0H87_009525 [Tephrocybe sp. NHM501043]|nr:hypothetical protein H0H87_009525 [Tephrocybe sp. NHM501043]